MKKGMLLIITMIAAITISSTGSVLTGAVTDYLDYGFYWVKADTGTTKAVDANGNAIPVGTQFNDPSKPVVVYFHGWQKGTSAKNYQRESFQWVDSAKGINQNTIASWKNAGWNVLIFYWNQFADEDEVKDAEAKMWSVSGPRGMRYRLSDGSYKTTRSPNESLSDIAFDQYVTLTYNNTNTVRRFAGHSLGNQLATNVAKLVSDNVTWGHLPAKMMPERLELLDPFWSKDGKSYLGGKWTGQVVREHIAAMKTRHSLAVTWYKTSGILDLWVGDYNSDLTKMVAYIHPAYWYFSSTQIAEKHVAARHSYFWSYAHAAPVECTINWLKQRKTTGNVGASAKTTTTRIRQMMVSNKEWMHVEGRYTASPGDDWQEVKSR